MKKFLFIFITLFIFISNSKAETFYLGNKIPNMHIETITNNYVVHNGVPFMVKRSDGNYVYCLDQHIPTISGNYNEYKINNGIFSLSDEQLNKINLLAYFGYQYNNHTDIKWYGVTQFLIWKELKYRDIFFTDKANGNRIEAYINEVNEINNLVNNYIKLPSFYNNSFEFNLNNKYEILDSNRVLNGYEIKESNIDAEINNNALYIYPKKGGEYSITFIKKSPVNRDYILYNSVGNQPLIYPGRINDIEFKINIKVNSGSVTINNFDSENKVRDFAKLEGSVYGIYDDNELITTITIDSNNIGYLEGIPLGKYLVKQLHPGLGYKLDSNIYYINVTKENKDVFINSYNKVIEGDLLINKYYGEENNYKLEDKAMFEIYNINDKFVGEYETIKGVIKTKLEYGYYYITQKYGVEGYRLVDREYINVLEEKQYGLNLYDELIKGNFIIHKYYGEKDNYKLEDKAIFEIYNTNNNLIGEYETKDGVIDIKLDYGDYNIIQKKGIDGYKLVDKFNISIKENKEYIVDLYNEKELLIVEVPNTSKYNYNNFISILFIILGLILIIKHKKKTT